MNFSDTIQHWLQGQINAAVDGHSARLEHLEAAVTHAQYQDERIKRLETQAFELSEHLSRSEKLDTATDCCSRVVPLVEGCVSSLNERLTKLEKAYPDMATTKDLQKDTRPEVLMDKLQPLIEQLIRNELEECVSATETAVQPPSDDDKRDAQRYRWLRNQHWSDNVVGIVRHPGEVLKLGTVCYSDASLDRLIDEALAKEQV